MSARRDPAMSVVLVTPDTYATIRMTMSHLRAQTARDQLEIVIVAPSAAGLALDEAELRAFATYQVVEVGASLAGARAAGVRRAAAPLVALAEDHCFPEPEWASALIAAHHQPWAVVGPVFHNANPATALSQADFLMAYSPWAGPRPGGLVSHLPGHNSCYKRDILMAYGPRLEELFDAESVLHWDLRQRGERLWLEPAARVAHVNFSLWRPYLRASLHAGQVFAATRAAGWPGARRALYTVSAPLIPLVRLTRIVPVARRLGVWRALPALLIGLAADGVGQGLGYALGARSAAERLRPLEAHRVRFITAADRRAIAARAGLDGDAAEPEAVRAS